MLAQRTRRCKWLIVQMHVSVKKRSVFTLHCEEMPDTCVERTTCHGKRKK